MFFAGPSSKPDAVVGRGNQLRKLADMDIATEDYQLARMGHLQVAAQAIELRGYKTRNVPTIDGSLQAFNEVGCVVAAHEGIGKSGRMCGFIMRESRDVAN